MATLQDGSLGLGVESTFGTYAAPTRFYEDAGAQLDFTPGRVQGQGLRVGSRVARSARRVTTTKTGGGSTPVEASTKGMGLLFESMLGTGVSTNVSGSTYQQLFTLDTDTLLPSRTLQTGVVRADGTVDAISYLGCRVASWRIGLEQGGILMVEPTWDVRNVTTSESYATPSYPSSSNLLHFAHGAIAIGGVVTAPTTTALASGGTAQTNVVDFELTGDNKLNTERFTIGNAGLKSGQVNGMVELKGKMTVEYTDVTLRDAYLNDTPLALLLTFTSAEALSSGFASLQIVLPEIKLNGDIPKNNGGELIQLDVEFDALDNLTATQPIWLVSRTADTAL